MFVNCCQSEREFQNECATDIKPRHTPYQTKENVTLGGKSGLNSAVAASSVGNGGSTKGNRSSKRVENKSNSISQSSSFSTKKPLPPTRLKSGDSINNTDTIQSNKSTIINTPSDPLTSLKSDLHFNNTKYVFYLTKLSCHIEDHENNIFDLDYFNPIEPKIVLAGEVEGLKPKAITEKTIESKIYIINRNGNAIQVVGNQEMNDLEVMMKMSPDSMKYIKEAIFPPCDLGGAKIHTYFKRRYELFLRLFDLIDLI